MAIRLRPTGRARRRSLHFVHNTAEEWLEASQRSTCGDNLGNTINFRPYFGFSWFSGFEANDY